MGDEVVGDRGNAHKAVESRGRRKDEWPGRAARAQFPELEPTRYELIDWLEPRAADFREPPDFHLQFFRDLLAVQGSEPLSPRQAQAIEKRSGLVASNVIDPAAREAALLGFQLVLTVASFFPPVSAVATGALVLLALVRGEGGAVALAATAVPIGRLGNTAKVIRALMKLGRVFRPATIQEYKAVAKLLVQRDRNLSKIKTMLKEITKERDPRGWKAVKAAVAEYNRALSVNGAIAEARVLAGNAFHKAIGAAGAGEGVDIVYKGGKFFIEVKTHYVPIVDDLVLHGGKEQVLAYVLKHIVEKGAAPQARVAHFFIEPATGKAVKLIVDPLNGQKIVDSLLRLGGKK